MINEIWNILVFIMGPFGAASFEGSGATRGHWEFILRISLPEVGAGVVDMFSIIVFITVFFITQQGWKSQ